MAITKTYTRVNWLNYESGNTALNEANLNNMDKGIDDIANDVVALDSTKLDESTANPFISSVSYDEETGIFTFRNYQGEVMTINTGISQVLVNFDYDEETQKLIIYLKDGTRKEIDLSAFITVYEFLDSDHIDFEVVGGKVTATIKKNSITEEELEPNYLADIKVNAQNAANSAQSAYTNAIRSEVGSDRSAQSARDAANTLTEVIKRSGMTQFSVDFETGNLIYTNEASYRFKINRLTGNLEWEVV